MHACHSVSAVCRPAAQSRRCGEIGSVQKSILVEQKRPFDVKGLLSMIDKALYNDFTIDELFSNYNLILRTLLDKHLPVRKMTRRVEPLTPWFDADCVGAKRNVRRLERLYHRSSFMSDRKKWVEAICAMHALFSAKERAFWEKRIESVAGDSKKCWRAMNKLMCKTSNSKIPDGLTAEAFSRFFAQKVEAVRAATAAADPPVFTSCLKPCTFESFKPLSQDQILFLIRRAPDKTSELDPIPTWLVRECAEILAPFFAHVFNASLLEGYLSADQKRAIIYPGLKKPSLDPDDMASYRPISNLSLPLSCWSELFMPSYLSISMRMNFYLLFSLRIDSFSQLKLLCSR